MTRLSSACSWQRNRCHSFHPCVSNWSSCRWSLRWSKLLLLCCNVHQPKFIIIKWKAEPADSIYICFYRCIFSKLTGHFIRFYLLVPCWTAFILRGIDSTKCWKHSSEILVHADMMASLSATHPWRASPVPPHPKAALLDRDLLTVEAIEVQWTNVMFKKPEHCPAGSSHQRMFMKGWTPSATILW